jgi:hypothetical protein
LRVTGQSNPPEVPPCPRGDDHFQAEVAMPSGIENLFEIGKRDSADRPGLRQLRVRLSLRAFLTMCDRKLQLLSFVSGRRIYG